MFEDSLVESTHRIRTRSRRYVVGSFLLEAALLAVIVLVPCLYPAALPQKYLSVPLIAPPPAAAPQMLQQRPAASPAARPELLDLTLTAPPRIPTGIHQVIDMAPPGMSPGGDLGVAAGNGPPGALFPSAAPPPAPRAHLAKPSGPIHISSGVAGGRLIVPIRPHYPILALEARIQGTVVVCTTISTEGRIEDLRVLSGPPLLVNAAVDAIRQARYRPYLLNGQPVEVETTITVVFRLDGGT